MAGHTCKNKSTAKKYAEKMRKKGFKASIYNKQKGYGVSVRR